MKFKIGDVVICIKAGHLSLIDKNKCPPLREGNEYIIQNVYQCPICKEWSVDVGLAGTANTICFCKEYIPGKGIHWCSEKRFALKEPLKAETEEKIKEESMSETMELFFQDLKISLN